jgi:hypothetical protein
MIDDDATTNTPPNSTRYGNTFGRLAIEVPSAYVNITVETPPLGRLPDPDTNITVEAPRWGVWQRVYRIVLYRQAWN